MSHHSSFPQCLRCDSPQDTNLQLDCNHALCLVCLSFITIKLQSKLNSFPTEIECPLCGQITALAPNAISFIRTTIENVLVPEFRETLYSSSNSPYTGTIQRPIEELSEPESPARCSMNQKLTGLATTMNQSIDITGANKSANSHCSSPKLYKQSRQHCKHHLCEQYMFTCSDCDNQFLCLKCFTDETHSNHNIRSIKKTLEFCVEQVGFSQLELGERIELFELGQKRLVNRKQLVKTRLEMSLEKIAESFDEMVKRLVGKKEEMVRECNQYFGKIEHGLDMEIQMLKERIEEAELLLERVGECNPKESPLNFIRVCGELEKQLQQKQTASTFQIFKKSPASKQLIEIPSALLSTLYQHIDSLSFNDVQQSRITKQLRMDTVPSLRTRSYQKAFRTEKTDPGEEELSKQASKIRMMEETKSNASPDQLSHIISRQYSCKNMFNKEREQFSITSNDIHQQSFASSKPLSRESKERKERKTMGICQVEKVGKVQKSQFEKKLKRVINKNK